MSLNRKGWFPEPPKHLKPHLRRWIKVQQVKKRSGAVKQYSPEELAAFAAARGVGVTAKIQGAPSGPVASKEAPRSTRAVNPRQGEKAGASDLRGPAANAATSPLTITGGVDATAVHVGARNREGGDGR